MEEYLPRPDDPNNQQMMTARSAVKSIAAGVAGAVLTNPLDVMRNEYVYSTIMVYVHFPRRFTTLLLLGCSKLI